MQTLFCESRQSTLIAAHGPRHGSSLQVFESETHASIHSDKTKEGLSLFG
jgi:hypothetical protein